MSAYYIRFITLYIKELRRFTKIPGQTILAPAATTLLFMIILVPQLELLEMNL